MVSRLVILLLVVAGVCRANDTVIYKHQDASGSVSYSDSADSSEGSRTEKLPDVPMTVIAAPPGSGDEAKSSEESGPVASSAYALLRIAAPAAGQQIRSNNGNLKVVIESIPLLAPSDAVLVVLDGAIVARIVAPAVSAVVPNVDRGEHSLQLVVVDGNNQVLQQSRAQMLQMHRYSALTAPR